MLLTGDDERVTRSGTTAVGLSPEHLIAEVLPEDKADAVRRLRREGRTVATVGGGVDDVAGRPRPTWASPWARERTRRSRRAT